MGKRARIKPRGSFQRERRRYVAFLYVGGCVFFLLVVVAVTFRVLYTNSVITLGSAIVDEMLYEILVIVGETGFGSAVMELLNEEGLAQTVRVFRMGIPDTFSPAGSQEKIRGLYGLTPKGIAKFCRGVTKPR